MDWLHHSAERTPDAPALIVGGRSYSYAEFDAAADSVASTLVGTGTNPGDRVVFPAEASISAAAAIWGIPRAGAAAVPLDPRLPPATAMDLTRSIGVKTVWSPTELGWLERRGRHRADEWGPPSPDAGYVVFTSGTGGTPKGVVLTGATIEASVAASQQRLGNGEGDGWLCVLPLHHVGGLSILWRSARDGGTVILEDRFDPISCVDWLRSGRVQFISLVATMLRRILEADSDPYEGLKVALVGGGPVPLDLLEQAQAAGIPALATYGSTEATSQIATQVPGDEPEMGALPLDGVEVRIADDDGQPLDAGEFGRIQVRGPVVSPGYAGEPGRLPDAWTATGDLGSLDAAGRLSVAGRADGVIVTGGENVVPSVVEEVIAATAGVEAVRVFGEADPEWGTAVIAEVVLTAGADLDEVRTAVRSRLARQEMPRHWRPVERIERGWKQH